MAEFAPDGAWNEGPLLELRDYLQRRLPRRVESALGTDFWALANSGFRGDGFVSIYLTGPLADFNYADGSDGDDSRGADVLAGAKFGQPAYARYQQPIPSPAPLDLVWFDSQAPGSSSRDLDLDKYFRGVEVATFRSAWNDRDAVFVGFKAGDNKANHSNLDLGTFVLDALGTRWALDLGADNYNMPGYFGKQRWTYYRMRAEGHSVLAINPGMEPDQDPAAAAKIVRFQSNPQRAFAVADLTPAYARMRRRSCAAWRWWIGNRFWCRTKSGARTPAKCVGSCTRRSPRSISDRTTATLTQGTARLRSDFVAARGDVQHHGCSTPGDFRPSQRNKRRTKASANWP